MRLIERSDFLEINTWRMDRDLKTLSSEFYPKTGLIEPGLAAGWLTKTDSGVGLLENFVSNPLAKKSERKVAILRIAHELQEIAKQMGLAYLFAITDNEAIENHAKTFGFEDCGPCRLFAKQISN
jgi:hypothetical protein